MFDRLMYFVWTFAEAGLAVFGINSIYEQPPYTVRTDLGDGLEIRDYRPVAAVETTVTEPNRDLASSRAFNLLFAYIAGANTGGQTIAMTTPVQQESILIPMTAPVRTDMTENGGETVVTMRFFLPATRAANPPVPQDPGVRLTIVPGATVAALRFSGNATERTRVRKEAELLARLGRTAWQPAGTPYLLGYDPPFTIPFLKRSEVVVAVSPRSGQPN